MLTVLVTIKVLFSRKNNEMSSTPMYPVGPYVEGEVDLDAEGDFIWNNDDWRHVTAKLYEVCDVTLPEFLSVKEWVRDAVRWKWAWGCGVDPTWCEAWQRSLAFDGFNTAERIAVCKLLKVKKFRSEFRKSLRDQVVTWMETPVNERKYNSPFSNRQWNCLIRQPDLWHARNLDSNLYRDRNYIGAPVQ